MENIYQLCGRARRCWCSPGTQCLGPVAAFTVGSSGRPVTAPGPVPPGPGSPACQFREMAPEDEEPPASRGPAKPLRPPRSTRRAWPLAAQPPGASLHPNLPGCALSSRRAARVSTRLRSSFSVFESIKKKVAGGGRPPKRLREPSCGDFHSLPQVLQNRLTLRVQSFSCQFLPIRPQVCLISENPRLPRGSGGFHLEGR